MNILTGPPAKEVHFHFPCFNFTGSFVLNRAKRTWLNTQSCLTPNGQLKALDLLALTFSQNITIGG